MICCRLAKTNDAWGDDQEEKPPQNLAKYCQLFRCTTLRHTAKVAIKDRKILFIGFAVFTSILVSGIVVIWVLSVEQKEELLQRSNDTAIDFDHLMSAELFKALVPLHALSELVTQLDLFDDLPEKASNATFYENNGQKLRNVTDIWTNTSYAKPFSTMASSIKTEARMKHVIENIQLAPAGIVSLVYPEVDIKDFSNQLTLDSRSARGHDLFEDPQTRCYANDAIKEKRTVIQGPLTITQEGNSVAREALIANKPIFKDHLNSFSDGTMTPFWGFASVSLNWKALESRLKLDEFFSSRGFEHSLYRTETVLNFTTNEKYKEVRKKLVSVVLLAHLFLCNKCLLTIGPSFRRL